MVELKEQDEVAFRNFTRLLSWLFEELEMRVGPHIKKQETFWRETLPPGLRLAITLRYLASGDTYQSLSYNFRVASNTIGILVSETCQAIIKEYGE